MTPGRSRRASAMTVPGIVLSQPLSATTPSKRCPRATSSMESAMTSRDTRLVRMPLVPIVIPSEIATVLSSIGVPPASRMPVLDPGDERSQVEVARHGLDPRGGHADDRLGERLVVVADALQVRARCGAAGALGEGAAAVLEVEGDGGGHRRAAYPRRCRGGCDVPVVAGGAAQALLLPLAQAPEVAADRLGSIWRPGRCMFALEIRRRSSPVSAIHLASTSSESGSSAEP